LGKSNLADKIKMIFPLYNEEIHIIVRKDREINSVKDLRGKKVNMDKRNNIIQSSSMVENINSILRPYLNNSKNQINQNFLNLFMFYHNHREYSAGKRKGKTPMELLTKTDQKEDWIELLFQTIEKKQLSFFL